MRLISSAGAALAAAAMALVGHAVHGAAPAASAAPAAAPVPAEAGPVCEAQWRDDSRQRTVPVRIRMPAGSDRVPLILFSHGLGGGLDAGTRWAQAWVAAGFAVIHLQHPGSDLAGVRQAGLRGAMTAEQLVARGQDVRFVLDRAIAGGREGACDLGRIDRTRIGMAGHSFGAQTTLAVAGMRAPGGAAPLADPRIRAAIALSPQPSMALGDAEAFGAIRMPFLSITGTKDALPWLNQVTAADRERPFRAMAPGDKYLLVLAGGNHGDFGGRAPGAPRFMRSEGGDEARIAPIVIDATTLFWRATLRDDRAAATALGQFGTHLAPGDRFERR